MSKEQGTYKSLFNLPGLNPELHHTFNQIGSSMLATGNSVDRSISMSASVASFHALEYITNEQVANKEHVSGKSIGASVPATQAGTDQSLINRAEDIRQK